MNIKDAEIFIENRHNVIGEEGSFTSKFSQYSIAFLTKINEENHYFGYNGQKNLLYGITKPNIEGEFYNSSDSSLTFEDGSYGEQDKDITIE